jgi:hypothetical protein
LSTRNSDSEGLASLTKVAPNSDSTRRR